MHYKDFNIRILSKRGDGYDISVESPEGNARTHIELDVNDIVGRVQHISGKTRSDSVRDSHYDAEPGASPAEIGARLYESLFSGDVRTLYDRSVGSVLGDREAGLRIKLFTNLEDASVNALAQLPWEFIYEARNQEYLALSRQTPIVRYVEVSRSLNTFELEGRLRILVVMSSPDDLAKLDLANERKKIEESWAGNDGFEVDFLEHPTKATLLDALIENQYHVLHFMGHGAHDAKSGSSALILEDGRGNSDPLDADTFGTWLRDAQSLRLVFLNACDTAKTGDDQPFAGIANRLVMAGVPAVLAMQFVISDEAAIVFSSAFYSRIVRGFPVDEATTVARKKIQTGKAGTLEWATPVLFMRAPDGYLFKAPDNATPVATESPVRTRLRSDSTSLANRIFPSIIFVFLTAFAAYRAASFPNDLQQLGSATAAVAVALVTWVAAWSFYQCRNAKDPLYDSFLTFLILQIGVNATLIAAPISSIVFSRELGWSHYPATLFCGVVAVSILVTFLNWQRREATWIYGVATQLAAVYTVIPAISVARQFISATANPTYWTTDAFAFLHLLLVAQGLCAVVISTMFLVANHKYSRE